MLIISTDTAAMNPVRKILRLRSLQCTDVSETSFQITDSNGQSVVCECASKMENSTWIKAITAASEYQSSSLIGVHISDEDFEKMVLKKIAQIPLVDSNTVKREIVADEKRNDYAAPGPAREVYDMTFSATTENPFAPKKATSPQASAFNASSHDMKFSATTENPFAPKKATSPQASAFNASSHDMKFSATTENPFAPKKATSPQISASAFNATRPIQRDLLSSTPGVALPAYKANRPNRSHSRNGSAPDLLNPKKKPAPPQGISSSKSKLPPSKPVGQGGSKHHDLEEEYEYADPTVSYTEYSTGQAAYEYEAPAPAPSYRPAPGKRYQPAEF